MLPDTQAELIELIRHGRQVDRPRYDGTGRDDTHIEFLAGGATYHATYARRTTTERGIWAVYPGPIPRLCDAFNPILSLNHLDVFPGRAYSSEQV
jgi:hypothetical protein